MMGTLSHAHNNNNNIIIIIMMIIVQCIIQIFFFIVHYNRLQDHLHIHLSKVDG